jgi:hypothetical protein
MAVLGVHAEFWGGSDCPPRPTIDEIADSVDELFLPALQQGRRTQAVCTRRDDLGLFVVTVGVWFDAVGVQDENLIGQLTQVPLLAAGNTAALRFTKEVMQLAADISWSQVPKDDGRLHLDDAIRVEIEGEQIITQVSGYFDLPALPDPDFTHTIRDRLALAPQEGARALVFEESIDTDMDAGPDLIVAGLIAAMFSPLLGAVLIGTAAAGEAIAEGNAPSRPGLGAALAAGWPAEVLTRIQPPRLPGKFVLNWTELTVDVDGVATQGTLLPALREPRITVSGPDRVSFREATGSTTRTYAAHARDLRNPAMTWSGAAQGFGVSKRVLFHREGRVSLRVSAQDVDGLTGSASKDVQVSMIPLKPGQQPF